MSLNVLEIEDSLPRFDLEMRGSLTNDMLINVYEKRVMLDKAAFLILPFERENYNVNDSC